MNAKSVEKEAEDVMVVSEEPTSAKIRALREQIKMVNGLPDTDNTAEVLQQPRAQKLATP